MDFRVLGPLEVWDQRRQLEIPRRQQRALLGALLLRLGNSVSVDQLIDDLWGEQPPLTARGSLQNSVSGLRKALGADAILTTRAGYRLDIDPEQVDLFRFERLVARARSRGGPSERTADLGEALRLWRGPLLADLSFEHFVLLEAPRLEELRLAAREELYDVQLELGEHSGLIPGLETLVDEHPYNERLRAQLMLALYRSGRQADALDHYREARRLLVEELGLEPSGSLRKLEQAILRHDTVLTPAQSRPDRRPIRKTATAMYVELTRSGTSHLDPEALDQLVSRYAITAQRVIGQHGGTGEMLATGDVSAIFGVPLAHEDDALRAVRGAVQLRDRLEAIDGDLEPRIGISTGEVFVSGQELTAPATGAVLNVAKRLEAAAAAGEIVLDANTVRLVSQAARVDTLEPLQVGEEPPIGVWRLLDVVEGAPAIPRRFEAALVGRQDELLMLRQAFEASRSDAHCRLLILAGEPGVGKTRLAREFVSEVAPDATALTGKCVAYGEGASWLPVREVLSAAGADTRNALDFLLSAEPDGRSIARSLAAALGLAQESVDLEELKWAFCRFVEVLGEQRPLVVVIDDVQWAHPAVLDVIEALHQRAEAPLLLLCLSRPELLEQRTEWNHWALDLPPLAEPEIGELVDCLDTNLDSRTRDRVIELAEGNPLFAEQLVIYTQEDDARALSLSPPSIEALLASRLDLLHDHERALLQAAAVLGRDFDRTAVLDMFRDADAESSLARLVAKGLIHASNSGTSLGFHHALMRDVAYSSLPKAIRAELHQLAAEQVDGDDDGAHEVVGYHLEQAYRYRVELNPLDETATLLAARAAERLLIAAQQARDRGVLTGAEDLTSRALVLLPHGNTYRCRALVDLASILAAAGEVTRADELRKDAEIEAGVAEDGAMLAEITLARVEARILGDRTLAMRDALAIAEAALADLERLGDEARTVSALRFVGNLHAWLGRSDEAERVWLTALERGRHVDPRVRDEIRLWLVWNSWWGSLPADQGIKRCDDFLREAATNRLEATAHVVRGVLAGFQGRFDEARADIVEGRNLFAEIGSRLDWAGSAMLEGDSELLAGEPQAAYDALAEGGRVLAEFTETGFVATTLALQAQAALELARENEAVELAEEAEQDATEDDFEPLTRVCIVKARVLGRQSDLRQAKLLIQEAAGLVEPTNYTMLHADVCLADAEISRLAGRPEDARAALKRALALAEAKKNSVVASRIRAKLLAQ